MPPRNLGEELERDRRAAARDYSASLMSNAKWRVLLAAVADIGVHQIVVKFVDVDNEIRMAVPLVNAAQAFADSVNFGPFPFVGIEWIEFPAIARFSRADGVPAKEIEQNISVVRSAIVQTGKQFPLVDTSRGLRVIGHVR